MPLAWVWAWALQLQHFWAEFLVGQIGGINVTKILEASGMRHDKKDTEQGAGQNNIMCKIICRCNFERLGKKQLRAFFCLR